MNANENKVVLLKNFSRITRKYFSDLEELKAFDLSQDQPSNFIAADLFDTLLLFVKGDYDALRKKLLNNPKLHNQNIISLFIDTCKLSLSPLMPGLKYSFDLNAQDEHELNVKRPDGSSVVIPIMDFKNYVANFDKKAVDSFMKEIEPIYRDGMINILKDKHDREGFFMVAAALKLILRANPFTYIEQHINKAKLKACLNDIHNVVLATNTHGEYKWERWINAAKANAPQYTSAVGVIYILFVLAHAIIDD